MEHRIHRIELIPIRIKLTKPFVISLGRVDYTENLFIRIETQSGLAGYGECCPFRWINGESLETAMAVGKYLADALTGCDPLDIQSCTDRMNQVIFGNSSVKSAFDIALHDLGAQTAGMPLYRWLGGDHNHTLVTDYTVSIAEPAAMAEEAAWVKQEGYPAIKVKVGRRKEEDVKAIRMIREEVGPDIPLRLDANQGWDMETAIAILSTLDGMNIEFCEEPIPRWDFMHLPVVRKASPVPVMADESCSDHHDLTRLIDLEACDYINIKLGKSGGLLEAQKMLRLAEQAGMMVQVGGFVESRLGFTASAHLALSSDSVKWCDFDTPLMLDEDPVEGGLEYGPGGLIRISEEAGLGARVRRDT